MTTIMTCGMEQEKQKRRVLHRKALINHQKYSLFACLMIIFNAQLLFAVDQNEEQETENSKTNPLDFSVSVMGDFATNISGGVRKAGTYMGMVDLFATIDTEKAGLWKGGQIFLHGLNTHGGLATENLIGDIQVCSNIEAGDYTGLFEYYFTQQIGDFSLLLGQHDLNSEFVVVENGSNFINSSFGIPASLSLNFPAPIFPMASPAVRLSWTPSSKLKFLVGVYDGDPGDFESNRYGVNIQVNDDEGYLSIGEVQYHIVDQDGNTSGSYKIGGYYHSADCQDLTKTDCELSGKSGFYFVMDQALWVKGSDKMDGLKMFSQIGWGPSPANFVDFYFGSGFTYTSLFARNGRDQLGLGIAYSSINKDILPDYDQFQIRSETALELTYTYQITEYLGIQPDLQYIIKTDKQARNSDALVGIVRIKFEY